MKLLSVYRVLNLLLVACILGMGFALKHAQHHAQQMKNALRQEVTQNLLLERRNTELGSEVAQLRQDNRLPARIPVPRLKVTPITTPRFTCYLVPVKRPSKP